MTAIHTDILDTDILSSATHLLRVGNRADTHHAMRMLFDHLHSTRARLSADDWRALAGEVREHPVGALLREAPIFGHGSRWPRGYRGDAELMDMFYGTGETGKKLASVGPRGRHIQEVLFDRPSPRASRGRKQRIAQAIDMLAYAPQEAGKRDGLNILSIACGHLREAERCHALADGRVARFVALDQDRESLATVARSYGHLGVEIVNDSIGAIFKHRIQGGFDLIYSLGLYDYLNADTARALTRAAFEMLRPSGRLLIANFTPTMVDAGIMEAFMDWHLVYRNAEDMADMASEIPRNELDRMEIYTESPGTKNDCLIYLDLVKRSPLTS